MKSVVTSLYEIFVWVGCLLEICSHYSPMPKLPNILVTGTPGTGKTTFADMIAVFVGCAELRCRREQE